MEKLMADRATPPTLGAVMKGIRARNGWTLKEMSAKSGIPVSTLSKVEHDRLTLSYDKLQQLSQRLKIRMSDLFAEDEEDATPRVTGRRSIAAIEHAARVTTDNYDYHYLCTDLRQKRMIPILTRIRAHTTFPATHSFYTTCICIYIHYTCRYIFIRCKHTVRYL